MIDIERRLQHAARELREVEIEPPPLDHLGGRPRPAQVRRVPALVMPVLFVLGGLALVTAGLDRQGEVPDAAPVAESAAGVVTGDAPLAPSGGTVDPDGAGPELTARQEIALISSLGPVTARDGLGAARTSEPTSPTVDDVRTVEDVRTLTQRYR